MMTATQHTAVERTVTQRRVLSGAGRSRTRLVLSTAPAGALTAGYLTLLRPWQMRWGATDVEVRRALPGDALVEAPTFNATRAITIGGPPAVVWPWLVQVGVDRAGWYSYDLLDNLGRPSARRILPEFQHLQPGDLLPMSLDGKHGIQVYALDEPHWMIWGTPGETTWVWVLEPVADGATRLISRVRAKYRWRDPASMAFAPLLEFADMWMMRRMLLNLRARVEATMPHQPSATEAGRSRTRPA